MPSKRSETKIGRVLSFIPADVNKLYQYNFEHYRKMIEAKDFDKYMIFHGLFRRALQTPNVLHFEYLEESYSETGNSGYEYELAARFNPDTMIMEYNSGYGCPNRTYHHLGTKCPVCGSD